MMIPEKVAENIYEFAPELKMKRQGDSIVKFQMNVPARIYANEYLIERMQRDRTFDQITNVSCLPGVQKHVLALSDAHQGYGFCIGGVCGTQFDEGVVSPGGVGYDINCGVRLLRTNLDSGRIKAKIPALIDELFRNVPSGLGSRGKLKITRADLDSVLERGVNWAIENGYGWNDDRLLCEESGCLEGADATKISEKAKTRGIQQLGSLGSGNHFIEIQRVEKIFDQTSAKKMGIEEDKVMVMIHTGSRAMGHQVCSDYVRVFGQAIRKYKLSIPDRELACAPGKTKEAGDYLKAMNGAANFGFTNRHIIMHWTREAFSRVLGETPESLEMNLIYDVAHNILKIEEHEVGGSRKKLYVHRKGATRAFPPGHHAIPEKYKDIGQPVIIPGSMGTASYLCVGQPSGMDLSFGSSPHGSGREMSRSRAKREFWGKKVQTDLAKRGISIKAASLKVVAEEAPGAYKNIDQVVQVSHDLGIVKKVARLVPIGVTKG
ncbi:MAG: RtcB family protein [Promethearchaeota archaeon]